MFPLFRTAWSASYIAVISAFERTFGEPSAAAADPHGHPQGPRRTSPL